MKLARIKLFRRIGLIIVVFILLNFAARVGTGVFILCFIIFLACIGIGIMLTIDDAKNYINLRDDIKFERNFDNALARFASIPSVASHQPSSPLTKQIIWDNSTCHLLQNPTDFLNYKRYEIRASAPSSHSLTETGILDIMGQKLNEANTIRIWESKGLVSFNGMPPVSVNDILEVNIESNASSVQRGAAYTHTSYAGHTSSHMSRLSHYNTTSNHVGGGTSYTVFDRDEINTIYHVMVSVKDIHHPLYDLYFGTNKHNAYEVYSLLKALQNR